MGIQSYHHRLICIRYHSGMGDEAVEGAPTVVDCAGPIPRPGLEAGTSRLVACDGRRGRDPRREVLLHLGEKVRSLRLARGLTQGDLAQALHLSIAYVSLIERGVRNPPFTTVVAIARALGVSPRDICE